MLSSEIKSPLTLINNKNCMKNVIKIITSRDNVVPHAQRHSTHNDATQFLNAGVKVVAKP